MKRVVIWGAGEMGKMVYSPLVTKCGVSIIAYVDNCKEKRNKPLYGLPVMEGEALKSMDFELVFIALYDYRQIAEVREQLKQMKVPEEKIVELATDIKYLNVFMTPRFEWIKGYARWIKENSVGGGYCGMRRFPRGFCKVFKLFFPRQEIIFV